MSRTVTSPTTQPTNAPANQPTNTSGQRVAQEKIATRAYEKWVQRGRPDRGTDMQDWLEAEAELKSEHNRSGGTSTFRR